VKLVNKTNLPNTLIREVIRNVRPPGIEIKEIEVGNCKHAGNGVAYRKRLRIKLPRKDSQARAVWKPKGAYLGMAIGNRMEALVMLLAHELRHLWQAQGPVPKKLTEKRKPRKGMVWGARGVGSERDADAYAIHKLRQWRRGEL